MPLSPTDSTPRTLGQLLDDRLGDEATIALEDLPTAILDGAREITLDPAQIDDPLGSDRSGDWQAGVAFTTLKDSIAQHGQDVPVRVWSADPAWRPDPKRPLAFEGVRFHLLSGRRRTAACAALGRQVRAVIAPRAATLSDAEARLEMLSHRFRENDARENLSVFERLLSIGEMYEARRVIEGDGLNAASFAKTTGIANSLISRARSVLRHRIAIEANCEAPNNLTHRALDAEIARIEGRGKARPSGVLTARTTFKDRAVTATLRGTTLTVTAPDVTLNQNGLMGVAQQISMVIPPKQPCKTRD